MNKNTFLLQQGEIVKKLYLILLGKAISFKDPHDTNHKISFETFSKKFQLKSFKLELEESIKNNL